MSSSKLKLIINADDFGLTQNINEGILAAHVKGIVTSTSIVAQGEAFDNSIEIAKKNPTLDIGIHLTLVEERPLLNPEEVPTLVTSEGKFFPHAKHFFKRYLLGKISKDDVYRELDAQFNKVLNSGIKITHIDSHQHMHVLKDIFDVTLKLSLKYNIPVIRIPIEPIKLYMFSKNLPRIALLKVLNFISNRRKNQSFYHTNYFAGFLFGGNLNKENLLTILRTLPKSGVCEIMCHPGLADPFSIYSHWNYNWETELNSLISPEIRAFLNKKRIELINFQDLTNINQTEKY